MEWEREIKLSLNEDANDPRAYRTFEVLGCSTALLQRLSEPAMTEDRWRTIFQVFVPSGEAPIRQPLSRTPMLGTYQVEGELVRFSPRFPLLEGQRYEVRFTLDCSVTASFAIPRRAAPPTEVTRIYPSGDLLPENLLRFYIHFSAPMRREESLQHIRLLDSDGQEIAGVFLDTREELWDPSGTRLTLLLDPGRVKTGLIAHQRLGRALCAGRSYRLVIDREWRDARGEPLTSPVEQRFTGAPAQVKPLEVSRWQLRAPPAGTQLPLCIRFPEPLDHGLLAELMHVRSADDTVVDGKIDIHQAETVWEFLPQNPWAPGQYTVQIDGRLEDVAGNNLHGLFDRPVGQSPEFPGRTISLSFRCTPSVPQAPTEQVVSERLSKP